MLSGGVVALLADDVPPIPPLPTHADVARAPTFQPGERIVATHYFYWYRWPDEHFFEGRDWSILRTHFPDDTQVSYASSAWHRRQMEDVRAAGIDIALCVYWGAPNQYEAGDLRFSVVGIPPLVQALDELAADGKPTPRIGLFYDTTTLLGEHAYRERGRDNVDLRTGEGRDIFYRTIRDFYCLVPTRHWACVDGRPIVQLYESAFAAGHDQGTIDYVYEQFERDFGRRPFVIAGPSWSFTADARTGWGAALGGPIVGEGAAQVGPGYDDSPVPGRTTPTRDRLGGAFYSASWLLALEHRPRIVIVETWSELHEGTPICETREDGRLYIELTRKFSTLFKGGQAPAGADWAAALRGILNAPRSNPAGRAFAGRLRVSVRVEPAAPEGGDDAQPRLIEEGLRLVADVADGMWELTTCGTGRQAANTLDSDSGSTERSVCVRTRPGVNAQRYLYFDVADPYYFDHRGPLRVTIEYFDEGRGPILVQYDSAEAIGPQAGAYRGDVAPLARGDTREWKIATRELPAARCANRQNGGADLRLESLGGELAVRRVVVDKLPEGYGPSGR